MTTTLAAPTVRQVCLPGQAAVPDGPVDLTEMLAAHRAFRRDLDLFVAATRDIPLDDREAWRLLNRRWGLFCEVLHGHHTAEDEGVWPALRARAEEAGDRGTLAVLDAMDDEHADIDPLLASLSEGFACLATEPDARARGEQAALTVTAREQLGRHLDHEEVDALPLVQRYLSPDDWARIVKEHVARPASLRAAVETIGWGLHDLPDPVIARLLPAPVRLLWRLFVRKPFDRRQRRLLRYTT